MKIDETYQKFVPIDSARQAGVQDKAEGNEAVQAVEKTADPGAQLDLSRKSVDFVRAAEMMEREDPGRTERIRALTEQVRNGTYEVDSGKVAEKILEDALPPVMRP